MRHLFENEYKNSALESNVSLSSTFDSNNKSKLESMLDADFDNDDEEGMDKIDRYISEKPEAKGIDVLMWWKVSINVENLLLLPIYPDHIQSHQMQYPRLSRMARDYLAISAISTPCERAFSTAGNMIMDKRCQLTPKTTQAAQCLRSWIQGPLKGKRQAQWNDL